jgi:hypothetical protein
LFSSLTFSQKSVDNNKFTFQKTVLLKT